MVFLGCNGRNRAGLSSLELLIALVVVGLLISIVVPKLVRINKSKTVKARAQIEYLSKALETYKQDTGEYPSQEQGLKALVEKPANIRNWHGPYLKTKIIPKDPWRQPYIYRYPGKLGAYDLLSYGADRRAGGKGEEEDIVSWK